MRDGLAAPVEFIDHRRLNWSQVRRTNYLLHQRFRYDYPGPIENLCQRLVVFPPDIHGSQRLIGRHLQVSVREAAVRETIDAFGNRTCHLFLKHIEHGVEFDIRFLVESHVALGAVPAMEMDSPTYLQPSPLTEPDDRLRAVARELSASRAETPLPDRICAWVFANVAYKRGTTSVRTTAAEALRLGSGVCQDHAHVMTALCRLLGLPARYVSGHLLGEGATHAWVEVLAPDPSRQGRDSVQAFDPSHGRRCRPDYITVAVGRDYGDVAPTSGSFVAPYGGQLTAHKVAGITAVEYADPPR